VTALRAVTVAACSVASVAAGLRWLRVAQREHYLPGAVTRFALRWWPQDAASAASVVVAVAGVALAWHWPATALATALIVATGPAGLGLRGRTSTLAWTRRLRTLAVVGTALAAAAIAGAVVAGVGPLVAGAVALVVPLLVDLSTAITAPFERTVAHAHVRRATERLRRVAPTVVAITGSYGKTSTKGYVAHLLAGTRTVVASPASFNNRAGLARAVNENLADGTDVFVAEMGTYGPGEIAELCSWLTPAVSVITAIGPVHLERFRSEEAIVEAKAEILVDGATIVLNVDDPRLAALAAERAERGQPVRRVSSGTPDSDVLVRDDGDGLTVVVGGVEVGRAATGARPGNVACAVAVALELGVTPEQIAGRLGSLPTAPHRLESATGAGGFTVLDDTYNANPAGAAAALQKLAATGVGSARRVVVTPGLVELGPRQAAENAAFAVAAAAVANDLVVVGLTNRRALLAGVAHVGEGDASDSGGHRPGLRGVVVGRREEAVAWVRDNLGPGDVVLYENDLPDHYP